MASFNRAIAHMNADHPESLVDYVRYYGGDERGPVLDPVITSISTTEMQIAYKKRAEGPPVTVSVPFSPPLSGPPELRKRLATMGKSASYSRVPACEFPHDIMTYIIAVVLILDVAAVLATPGAFPSPFEEVVEYSRRALYYVFFNPAGARAALIVAAVAHAAQTAYVAVQLSKCRGEDSSMGKRDIYWIAQTAALGFQSLYLLHRRMSERSVEPKSQ